MFLAAIMVIVAGAPAADAGAARPCRDATTLLIVRHADRQGSEDALSEAGNRRALDLARAGEKAGVTAIYHSDTHRTRLTAEPLAHALGITPVELPGKDIDGLLKHVFANHCGGTVLIVGHSNTVPLIIAAAGGPVMPELPEYEFDNLFVLTVGGGKRSDAATLVNLRYGVSAVSTPEDPAAGAFFENLKRFCGERFEGASVFPRDAGDSFAGQTLVAVIDACSPDEIRIPFLVGEDSSRTWILTRTADGLLLKHDHRHADGTPDEITMYGGLATAGGSGYAQSFPADAHTAELIPEAATNVWTLSLDPDGTRLTYYLERNGQPRFKAELTRRRH